MAINEYSISLEDPDFPMLTKYSKRTIIGGSIGTAPAQEDRPGIMYSHNVMPTIYGYNAVGYNNRLSAISFLDVGDTLVDVRVIYSVEQERCYLGISDFGRMYFSTPSVPEWTLLPGPDLYRDLTTVANVNGSSYIFRSKESCFRYSSVDHKYINVNLLGVAVSNILCIAGFSGYLLAFTETSIAWSSLLNVVDFVPDGINGAGGGDIAEIKGEIKFVTANTFGLLIHTANNTVACIYTGNANYPFKFVEVEGSSGGIDIDLVAYEANSKQQFIYSKAGLQSVNSQRAEIILPEITDFLSGKVIEDFDEITNAFTITETSGVSLLKRLKFLSKRYLVISYGISEYTHALVVDTGLQKIGKLKIDHTDCFEYLEDQAEVAKESLALVKSTGEVVTVDFSETAIANGVILVGKLQGTRTRLMGINAVELENVESDASLSVYDMYSMDGKNLTPLAGIERINNDNIRKFTFRKTAKNHSILVKGNFRLSTMLVNYFLAGKR